MVGSLPASAGSAGSGPGLGGSHVPRSGWARGPQLLGLRVWSLCPATGGAAMVGGPRTAMESGPCTAMKSGPRLPWLEKALAQKRRPNTAKNKQINKRLKKLKKKKKKKKKTMARDSLVVQWLGLSAFTVEAQVQSCSGN